MEMLNGFFVSAVGYVWGMPLVIGLVGTGLFFTVALGGIQVRAFKHAIDVVRGKYDDPNDPGQISHFQALCTALSATVGLGNIAGVALAIHLGGPGALFWMALTGLVGMVTKCVECTLAVKYRIIDEHGVVHGGPMHYIERGLGPRFKFLGIFSSFALVMASFGAANMFQANQVASILSSNFSVPPLLTGVVLACLTALVIIKGITRIGKVTAVLVPFMAAGYVIGGITVIGINYAQIPGVVYAIFHDAFSGAAALGGFAGVAVIETIRQGVQRACFSNEAGIGSAPIAHAAATTDEPAREGLVALLEPFVDTVVICSMTALVILSTGVWQEELAGVTLTAYAFDQALPGFGQYFIPVAVSLFAFSTLISWSYYGERGADYLFGERSIMPYKVLFCALCIVGATWELGPVLAFSDLMFGLMALVNVVCLWFLFPVARREILSYWDRLRRGEFDRQVEETTSPAKRALG